MRIDVFNSNRNGPIYTTHFQLEGVEDGWVVTYRGRDIAFGKIQALALADACDYLLKGFNQPGVYTAVSGEETLAVREVL